MRRLCAQCGSGAQPEGHRGEGRHALGEAAGREKPAAKKRTHVGAGASGGRSLQSLTKAELYKKATAAGMEGRSTMTHDELADALAHTGRSRAPASQAAVGESSLRRHTASLPCSCPADHADSGGHPERMGCRCTSTRM
ncbi:hypothetical protein OV450_6623 [Actinobacteria bacterium OV450]|nr:hypothetical protein OV450_6623 [Actinobacteria bacterium OV450]